MTPNPKVSVVVATRNRPELLGRALRSIAAQTLCDLEVIVVDDGSDSEALDEMRRIIGGLDKRFVLITPPAPGSFGTGPAEARNRGIRAARGEFVAFLDDDDRYALDDHLEVGVRSLREHGADYFFTDLIGERGERLMNPGWVPDPATLTGGPRLSESPDVYEVPFRTMLGVLKRYSIHPDNTIARRDLLSRVGGFLGRAWLAEDYHMMMRLSDAANRILYRPDCAVRYRLPQGDAVSLMQARIYEKLSALYASHHVRLFCDRKEVRRCARARESWALRELSAEVLGQGHAREALSFAWQGACAYTTPGSIAYLAKTYTRSFVRRFLRSPAASGRPLDSVSQRA